MHYCRRLGEKIKSADPEGVPRLVKEWQVKSSAKRDDKSEEAPVPPTSRGRAPNFIKEWRSKTNAEPESIPQVQPPAKSRAKSEEKRLRLCS